MRRRLESLSETVREHEQVLTIVGDSDDEVSSRFFADLSVSFSAIFGPHGGAPCFFSWFHSNKQVNPLCNAASLCQGDMDPSESREVGRSFTKTIGEPRLKVVAIPSRSANKRGVNDRLS